MQDIITRFKDCGVLVVGDVVLDEYLIGKATRISREAPIPVLEFESRHLIPGGAANPAVNISRLGGRAYQAAVVGADANGHQLSDVLLEHHIDIAAIVRDTSRTTTVKTRIMAQMGFRFPQQIARIDRVHRVPISDKVQQVILESIQDQLMRVNAVLFSDYHAGLLTPDLVRHIVDYVGVHQPHVILTADAQGELQKYSGLHLVKCNANDAQAYLGRPLVDDAGFAMAARQLYEALGLTGAMVITRGADGATLADDEHEHHVPAPAVLDVYDTVGAGDTAIAVMTLALAVGALHQHAVLLANVASGLVIRKVGNYAPTPEELARAVAMWS